MTVAQRRLVLIWGRHHQDMVQKVLKEYDCAALASVIRKDAAEFVAQNPGKVVCLEYEHWGAGYAEPTWKRYEWFGKEGGFPEDHIREQRRAEWFARMEQKRLAIKAARDAQKKARRDARKALSRAQKSGGKK